ncbi:MAG: hypothetical protein GF331_06645 [Chitinivibrionales bacterium]|nr:hypothetical protein [Chitinivibrionales bacterium]
MLEKAQVHALCLVVCATATALVAQDDPLSETRIIEEPEGEELVLAYNPADIQVFSYRTGNTPSADTMLHSLTWEAAVGTNGTFGLAAGDLDGRDVDELVVVWDSSRTLGLSIARFAPCSTDLGLSVETESSWRSADSVLRVDWEGRSRIAVATGEFDGDEGSELVVACGAVENTVRILLFDIDTALAISLLDSVDSDSLLYETPMMHLMFSRDFDLATGDVDGDGLDEILVAGTEPYAGGYMWHVYFRCYDYDSSSRTIVAKAKTVVVSDTAAGFGADPVDLQVTGMSICAGRMRNGDRDDAVMSVAVSNSLHMMQFQCVAPIELSADLDSATIPGSRVFSGAPPISSHAVAESMVEPADLDGDSVCEIVSAGPCETRAYSMVADSGLRVINDWSMGPELDITAAIPLVADLDFRGDSLSGARPELCLVRRMEMSMNVYTLPSSASGELALVSWQHFPSPPVITEAITGNFNGNIRLGTPTRHTYTDIVDPMVILNAPPIHFDVFNDTAYDVSGCFNLEPPHFCPFVATYEQIDHTTTTVERVYNRDWGVSAAASAEVGGKWGFVSAKVKTELTAAYGEKFSKTSSSGQSFTVAMRTEATEEVSIYATVLTYNLWEYPVYYNDTRAGYVLVAEPTVTEDRWISSKGASGYNYAPDHEVGNILSYPDSLTFASGSGVAEMIKASDRLELHGTSSYTWYLAWSDFQDFGVSTSNEFQLGASMEAEASTAFGGARVTVAGSYGGSNMSTKQTSVSTEVSLTVSLGDLDMGVGEVRYLVRPYAYWSTNGALVLDYAVSPDQPTGTHTWWTARYGSSSDLTFVLPWKYDDPEKGYTLQDSTKCEQTKDIAIIPRMPDAGDTVTLRASVRNFALQQSPRPASVRFYLGDPDGGGTLITALDGTTTLYTDGAVPARKTKQVQMQWRIPVGTDIPCRIYAVIDPYDSIPEIHENNNKGWALLGPPSVTPVARSGLQLDRPHGLFHCVQTGTAMAITIRLNRPERIQLSLFDMRGRQVARLVPDRRYPAGTHRVTLDMDDNARANGALVLVGRAGDELWSRKMLFVR